MSLRRAFLLGFVSSVLLLVVQRMMHRRCPSCQRRWARIKGWLIPHQSAWHEEQRSVGTSVRRLPRAGEEGGAGPTGIASSLVRDSTIP